MASIISLAGTGNAPLDMAAIPKNVPLNITFALDDGQIVINSAIGRLNLPVYAFLTTSNDAEGYTYFSAGLDGGAPQYIAVPSGQTIQWFYTESFGAALDEEVGLWALSGATIGALLSPSVAITGSSDADLLLAGSAGSSIDPAGGADTVVGGPAADVIYGSDGADTVNGGEAGDVIYSATYDLYSDGEADNLNGEGGNDVFIGFDPADFVDGGEGYDVIRHSGTWSNIMPDGNWQDWGDPTTWHVSGIEAYETTDYVSAMPLLAGEGLADTTFGYIGGVTSAQLEFFSALRLAPDVIAEGANRLAIDILGPVEVDLSDQLGTLSVFIQSSGGEQDADIIETGDGDDVLWGWFGNDTLVGNGGNDWFSSFGTNVKIDGGGGELDRLSQLGAMGHGFNTWIVKWDITNVEILETADKRIYGTQAQFNVFNEIRRGDGKAGKIKLGLDGKQNTIDFSSKISASGLDLLGAFGSDKIKATQFADTIDGAGGIDTLVLSGTRSQYTITYQGKQTTPTAGGAVFKISGPDGVDTVKNVERVQFDDGIYPLVNWHFVINRKADGQATISFYENGAPIKGAPVAYAASYDDATPIPVSTGTGYRAVFRVNGGVDKECWELQSVAGRTAIQIHVGNYTYNSEGCIVASNTNFLNAVRTRMHDLFIDTPTSGTALKFQDTIKSLPITVEVLGSVPQPKIAWPDKDITVKDKKAHTEKVTLELSDYGTKAGVTKDLEIHFQVSGKAKIDKDFTFGNGVSANGNEWVVTLKGGTSKLDAGQDAAGETTFDVPVNIIKNKKNEGAEDIKFHINNVIVKHGAPGKAKHAYDNPAVGSLFLDDRDFTVIIKADKTGKKSPIEGDPPTPSSSIADLAPREHEDATHAVWWL